MSEGQINQAGGGRGLVERPARNGKGQETRWSLMVERDEKMPQAGRGVRDHQQ